MHAVLQPGTAVDHHSTPCHLEPEPLGRLVGLPDLWQETRGVQLGQHERVDLVGFHLGMGNGAHLQRVGDHHTPHVRCHELRDSQCVARGLDHDLCLSAEVFGKGNRLVTHKAEPPELACNTISDLSRLRKVAMNIKPDSSHDLLLC